jgi:hypothetical protein
MRRGALESRRMYFRSMTPEEDGLPRVGPSARTLGVRVPEDIRPNGGHVVPGTGGMSVSPDSMWNLPNHRRPRAMGGGSTGPNQDRVFSITDTALEQRELTARPDPEAPALHALVEPKYRVSLKAFEGSLSATRPDWNQAWP